MKEKEMVYFINEIVLFRILEKKVLYFICFQTKRALRTWKLTVEGGNQTEEALVAFIGQS